jgi:hypothetical protein
VNFIVAFLEERPLGIAALGAIAIVVGSVLPWIHVPQPLIGVTTGNGLQEDGKITILLGLLALGLLVAYARLRQRDLALSAGVAGLVSAGIGGFYLAQLTQHAARVISRLLSGGGPSIDPSQVAAVPARAGAGLFVVFAGAALLAASVFALTIREHGTTEPVPRASA